MDSTRIQPVGGKHAIEVMAIGVEWTKPLSEKQLLSLENVYKEHKEIQAFLPKHFPLQSIQLQAGFSSAEPDTPQLPHFVQSQGFAGFDLRRYESDGSVPWLVSVRPEFMSCNCADYDRWNSVKSQSMLILTPFVEAAVAAGIKISAIGLQYQDAFRLMDGVSPEVASQLFRKNTRWIASHLFDESSFWHCHHGWFSKDQKSRKSLNNVTVDMVEIDKVHFAKIGGQHRVFSGLEDDQEGWLIELSNIDAILDYLHQENKKVINGMLSNGALVAIGCKGEDS